MLQRVRIVLSYSCKYSLISLIAESERGYSWGGMGTMARRIKASTRLRSAEFVINSVPHMTEIHEYAPSYGEEVNKERKKFQQ